MMNASETAGSTVASVQNVLTLFNTYLAFGSYLCPTNMDCDTAAHTHFDCVIIGAGTAGLAMAHELSHTDLSVLVIEEGPCAPMESLMPGYFTMMPKSKLDRAYTIYNDSYTCQNQQPEGGATAGKMLGGTGSIDHMLYVRPCNKDLEYWCEAANDSSWCGTEMEKLIAKSENITDTDVLKYSTLLHGTDGPLMATRQQSCYNDILFDACEEMGVPKVNDTLAVGSTYANEPLLSIKTDGYRQNGNVGYLSKIKGTGNVKFITNARVEKILMNGTQATGVQFTCDGTSYNVSATTTVLAAGAMGSPHLLMLSGIGNSSHLKQHGIDPVVENNQVCQNLADHQTTCFGWSMNNTAISASSSPYDFPVPMMNMFSALNSSQEYPDQQTILLSFPPQSDGFLQLCYQCFKYNAWICDIFNKYNYDKNLIFAVYNLLHPKSTGSCHLQSSNITDQLIMKLGMFSNSSDLEMSAKLLQQVGAMLNTTTMKNVDAHFVNTGMCSNCTRFSLEFWKCYAVEMSSTMWHYSGTCAMGKVVDSSMHVMNTSDLMVIDASVIPYLPSGNIGAAVRLCGLKGAEIIKKKFNVTSCS